MYFVRSLFVSTRSAEGCIFVELHRDVLDLSTVLFYYVIEETAANKERRVPLVAIKTSSMQLHKCTPLRALHLSTQLDKYAHQDLACRPAVDLD